LYWSGNGVLFTKKIQMRNAGNSICKKAAKHAEQGTWQKMSAMLQTKSQPKVLQALMPKRHIG